MFKPVETVWGFNNFALDGQVTFGNLSYDEMYDVYGEVASRGLSRDSLKKLPCHVILDEIKAAQTNCCTICLQVNIVLRRYGHYIFNFRSPYIYQFC